MQLRRRVIIINESTFSLNKFSKPKMLEDKNAIYALLVRLILLEPGTIQSHPDMGIGLVSKYRYSFEGISGDLKSDIERQIEKFLPELQGVAVDVTDKDKTIYIKITIDNVLYDFTYNTETGDLSKLVQL